MPGRRQGVRRGRDRGAAAVAALVLAVGGATATVWGLTAALGGPPPRAVASGPAPASLGAPAPAEAGPARGESEAVAGRAGHPATGPESVPTDLGLTLPRSEPVHLSIPALDLRREGLVALGRLPDGRLEVPTDFGDVGWYEPGPAPGQFGPAVLAGHVDSKDGPAVFFRLGELRPGDEVQVGRADGRVATFTVDRVERHPKDAFPTVAVYGNTTDRAELRLITCGGEFDRGSGSYRDNVVVFAHLTGELRGEARAS